MNKMILCVILSVSAPVLATEGVCVTKQKNAASFALAQELGVAVQAVEVIGFDYGMWTEAVGNNVGSDQVTVRAGNRVNRAMTIKAYEVQARQIGATDDCDVIGTSEVKN